MLTEFGKRCRKIRIDAGELLVDMAKKLSVTPSYLSAVETGKRNVPSEWCDIICKEYDLDENDCADLKKAAKDSILQVKIDLTGFSNRDKDIVLTFARNFDDLKQEQKSKLVEILRGDNKRDKKGDE